MADKIATSAAQKKQRSMPTISELTKPIIDTIYIDFSAINFKNDFGGDTNLIRSMVIERLGQRYDTLNGTSSIEVYFDSISSTSDKSHKITGKYSGAVADYKIKPNFNPSDKKYRYQKPKEGFTFNITIKCLRINEEEIAAMISGLAKSYSYKIYDRSYYFKADNPSVFLQPSELMKHLIRP
ncbi:MAG: hypothetical protein NTY12_01830 [Candidatus Falkowbacteria bacterium]|nr:hypothetical protein [Candidatus Falkowbacteria bacterium]